MDSASSPSTSPRPEITALVPARNEAPLIGRTVAALQAQGIGQIIVVDDQSTDGTARVATDAGATVVSGVPLPVGWVGKLWALEQGRRLVQSPITLLVDADIELAPGLVDALLAKRNEGRAMVSLMAVLAMQSAWEKLLIPAFVYFFKLLYPFRISNSPSQLVAAAAGGCVMIDTDVLERIGGFGALKGALIDDCALARQVKHSGARTWVGLTHSVTSHRPMVGLAPIWQMVARSAFAQLRFSTVLLVLCVAMLVLAFWVPAIGLGFAVMRPASIVALVAMMMSYVPVLRFYGRSPLWAATLPVAGTLYLFMTIASAIRAWRGVKSKWKGRAYTQEGLPD